MVGADPPSRRHLRGTPVSPTPVVDVPQVSIETNADNHRRWVCTCGWATAWTFYTRPDHAAQAIRHLIAHSRSTVNQPLTADRRNHLTPKEET